MRNLYRNININAQMPEILDWIRDATRNRRFDLDDYNRQDTTLPVIFDAPSSSSDIIGTEKAGDISADANFLYIVVDNAGTLEWRRVAISSF